jgi:hypothetical protein
MVKDHLVDAEDRNGGVELVLRSGDRRRIDPGSWLVNCTGYVFKKRWPYEPYMSANGNVAVATPRSYVVPLSSLNSYFLAHLMMLGTLADLPLYALDLEELYQRSRETCACAAVALLLYNLSVITDNAPRGVFIRNGLDMDRWFPLPRYSFGILQWLRTHRREREHVRRTLDTVRERFDVRCGPIV